MSEVLFPRTALIGLGQMGASLGMALKQTGLVGEIAGYDLHPDHSSTALSLDAIDRLAVSAPDAVRGADLAILCTPVGSYGALAQAMAAHLKPGACVTDIGSIKAQAIRDIAPHLPEGVHFIPAHPIAGSEQTGPYHAHAEFFRDHLFLITPIEHTDPALAEPVATLWQAIGARVELLSPQLHDAVYAYMSHLPQLLAFAVMPQLAGARARLKDGEDVFGRFIRIGRSDAEMWRDVFLENAAHLLPAAERLSAILTHMRDELLLGGADMTAAAQAGATPPPEALLKAVWPRVLASALITAVQLAESQLEMKLARFAAGGFTDVSCPAMTDTQEDFELVSQHAATLIGWLDAYLARQSEIVTAIESGDGEALLRLLATCQAEGKRLLTPLH